VSKIGGRREGKDNIGEPKEAKKTVKRERQ
jgi:hypothetical protein